MSKNSPEKLQKLKIGLMKFLAVIEGVQKTCKIEKGCRFTTNMRCTQTANCEF